MPNDTVLKKDSGIAKVERQSSFPSTQAQFSYKPNVDKATFVGPDSLEGGMDDNSRASLDSRRGA